MLIRLSRTIIGVLVMLGLGVVAAACAPDDQVDPESAVLRLILDSCERRIGNRATAAPIGDGLALTVAHSFDAVEGVTVIGADGSQTEGTLVFRDRDRDLALISFDDSTFEADVRQGFAISSEGPTDSTQIAYHRDEGPFLAPVEVLRQVDVTLDGIGRRSGLELAGDILPGDSGAPVLDDEGRIVGLVFASSRVGERGWAVSADEFRDLAASSTGAIPLVCD